MINILQELNKNNSSNYKLSILEQHKANALFKRILKMSYDKVTYTYGITTKNITRSNTTSNKYGLLQGLELLEEFNKRILTGNKAQDELSNLLNNLSDDDAYIIERILARDLRCNINKSQINKVFKDLITKPNYQRCEVYTEDDIVKGKHKKGTSNKIQYPAVLTLKCDGSYIEANVSDSGVTFTSRAGEDYSYPILEQELMKLPKNRRYFGELTIELNDVLLNTLKDLEDFDEILENYKKGNKTLPRKIGNGLLNSDNPPHENIVMNIWEYVTEEEYQNAKNKVKNKETYIDRFHTLINWVQDAHLKLVPFSIVLNKQEAKQKVQEYQSQGLEGGVLKNYAMTYKDGTSKDQLKMKLKISAEFRVVGFIEGKKGTKREQSFGSILFINDECTIKGSTSGFNDADLIKINSNRESYIGKIIEVEFNDLTKAQGNFHYALSHPRFVEFRTDKDSTNTLEEIQEMKRMQMDLE